MITPLHDNGGGGHDARIGTSGSLFRHVDLEARIPAQHPLRKIRQVVNEALASLDAEFTVLYTDFGPRLPVKSARPGYHLGNRAFRDPTLRPPRCPATPNPSAMPRVTSRARRARTSTRRPTLGADTGYDTGAFVSDLRQACVTQYVDRKAGYSAIDGRNIRHAGYGQSRKHRNRIEEAFGWAKTVGGMAETMYRGVERVRPRFILTMAANDPARLPRLLTL